MKKNLKIILLFISLITISSGILQFITPGFVLQIVGAEITPISKHLFGIIGMFMAFFGGMMIHALYGVNGNEAAILWASFQKIGAAAAIGLGIFYGIFNWLSASVAVFDLLSGLIFLWYYKLESKPL